MFTSEFQEKEKKEISLPGKKANEVKELLQVIYPTVERKPPDEIKDENCHYLLSLAHEYQMAAITQRCEDFIVKIMKESFSVKKDPDIIAELVFAQTYNLKKLKQASIELAQSLALPELKKQKGYDEIRSENLQEIMERMITRLQSQLTDTQTKLSEAKRIHVKIMKESFSAKKNPDIIAELVFAQTYNLKTLKQVSIELAQNKESNREPQDFTQPWKSSDVVLVVEGEKLHVHRAVLTLCSPVFETMFTSEFQEKEKKEISLPHKKVKEVKELLQVIYPTIERKPPDEIKEENCHYLLSLAHEYQMAGITQRCENFIVKTMKESFSTKKDPDNIAELVFAQTYNLKKLKQASIELA
ncbi:unnamed protein product [Porites lobata]|uniref:BTB domain-containing protein n=1 Tax=Porites lobata TaxID=104759 RepID=A0ABN8QQ66_9CNID|nr:unnamed protein product [Porites lobata]